MTLSDFFDDLFLAGKSSATGEKTLAAVEFMFLQHKGKLMRARRSLKGWRKIDPPRSRLPLPRVVACGIAAILLAKGQRKMGDDRLRLLSSTRRRDGRTRKACREAVEKCRPTISTVLPSDQRSGRRCTRQDRHFRQHSSFRQPSDEELVGASIGEACSDIGEDQSDFRLQARRISGGIPKSGRDPGFEQPPHLSAPPWRGQRRLELEAEGPSCGPRKREMANGCQRTSLRQVREDSKAAARSSEGQVGFLQMGGTQHGEHGDRKNSCKNSMSGSWRDCREPFVFAGSGRLTSTLKELGINAHALDILTDPLDDVLSPKVKFKIFDLVKRGIILFVWIGMPCTTFSVARRHDGVGPPPLRSDAQPMGLDFLRPHDKKKLKEGNALLLFTYDLALCCMRYGVPWAIENPASSRCWLTPVFKKLAKHGTFVHLDFCQFHEPWKKPTSILYHGIDFSSVGQRCTGGKLCSRTGKNHLILKGISPSGEFWTLIAQPYPWILVRKLGQLIFEQIFIPQDR